MKRMLSSHVLITSCGGKAPLVQAMKFAARKLDTSVRVVAGDIDPDALTRFVADDFWVMPCTDESQIDAILDGCRKRGIGVILPTRDGELMFWARVRSLFADAGISVVVSDIESLKRCLDKLEFANFCRSRNLPVIFTSGDLDACGSGPFVVKERYGSGSRSVGLRLERAEALEHSALLAAPIYQPFVEGREVSIDGWIDNGGAVRGVVLRRRDLVIKGEAQVSTTFHNKELEDSAIATFQMLGLRGPVMMQAIVGADFGWHIIECNARFGGASTTAIGAGLDMLYWSLCEARDPTSQAIFERIIGEVRQVRIPSDLLIYDASFRSELPTNLA